MSDWGSDVYSSDLMEFYPDFRQVCDLRQRVVTGEVTKVGVAREHHAIERCGHRIVAHAVVALDHHEGLSATHSIALLHAHGPHGPGKARPDLRMAVVIDRDAAHQAHRVADHRRSGDRKSKRLNSRH